MKPNTRRHSFLLLLTLLLLVQECIGQTRYAEKNRLERSVVLVKEFANRAFSFEDQSTRVLSLARFADLLWKEDEVYARQLFARALDSCAPRAGASQKDIDRLARLRREVIVLISNRDLKLAKQLAKAGDGANAAEAGATNLRLANRLLQTQPEQAVGFAERSVENGVSLDLVFFLLRLRTQNQPRADRLFLEVINRLSTLKCVDAESLLALGTYVFTSAHYLTEANVEPATIKYTGVGPVILPDISAERPEASRELILAYLNASANLFSSSMCPAQDRATLYAAGYLLHKKAARLAPDAAMRIASSMQSLRQGVPAELLEDDTYKKVESRASRSLDETLADIENKAGVEYRDIQYFALVFDLSRRSDFAKARIVNTRISDVKLRDRLDQLILFGEAARAIEEQNRAEEAERIITKLPLGIERTLLQLGLASLFVTKNELARAEEFINASLRDARRLDDNRVPFIMLAVASELARMNSPDALPVLAESIRKLNAEKANATEVVWEEKIACGPLWRNWPIEIKGVSYSFSRALPHLMKADADVTVETILKLTSEKYLSEALLETAEIILNFGREQPAVQMK